MQIKLILSLFLFFYAFSSFAEKIIFIDSTRVVKESKSGKALRNDLEKTFNSLKDKFEKEKQSLEKERDSLSSQMAKDGKMTEAINKKMKALDNLTEKLRTEASQADETMRKKEAAALEKYRKKLDEIAKEIAVKESVSLVLDKAMVLGNLDPQFDRTDMAIQLINDFSLPLE